MRRTRAVSVVALSLTLTLGTPIGQSRAGTRGRAADEKDRGPVASQALPKPPRFVVTRIGRPPGFGESVAFPARGTPKIIPGERILEGRHPDDGFLYTARSADGRRLWVKRGTDDGNRSVSRFDWRVFDEAPEGAVLQMVDGFSTPDPSGQPGWLGSTAFKRGSEIRKQHHEAWVALPKEKVIIRPADGARYPLLPAAGPDDESRAAKAQWVVFVPKCKETKGPCVYYGDPVHACARSYEANEADALIVFPWNCDTKLRP